MANYYHQHNNGWHLLSGGGTTTTSTSTSKSLLLLVILLLSCCALTTHAQVINSMSPRFSYVGGGTTFLIDGTGFLSAPIVQVTSPSGTVAVFALTLHFGDLYSYTVPPEPSNASKKRPLNNDIQFDVIYNGGAIFTNTFEYLTPKIKDILPMDYYPITNNKPLIINGDHLRLSDSDVTPVVSVGGVNCHVIDFKPNEIKCTLGNAPGAGAAQVQVTLYSGLTITSPDQLTFHLPVVNNIVPSRITAGRTQIITLNGLYLYDDKSRPASVITFGGEDCTNIVIVSDTQITCESPLVDVAAGNFVNEALAISIGAQPVLSAINLEVYTPQILTILPQSGLAAGGTTVRVTGLFLREVTAATIGGSACVIVVASIADNQFDCVTSAYNLGGASEATFILVATIDGQTYDSPNTEQFTYFVPVIQSLVPVNTITKGTFPLEIKGKNFFGVTAIQVGTQTINTFKITSDENAQFIDIDASLLAVGDNNVIVQIGTTSSNTATFVIVSPSLQAPTPADGFMHVVTPISIPFTNFPTPPTVNPLTDYTKIFINGLECTGLAMPDASHFSCNAPVSAAAGAFPITFKIYEQDYDPAITFTYYDLTITGQGQTTNIPAGGGVLTIDGTHLDVVNIVNINNVLVVGCTLTAAQISCPIPPNVPGNYPVTVIAAGVTYPTTGTISYVGPNLDLVTPRQGNARRTVAITCVGNSFGAVAASITITVGGVNCPGVAVLPQVAGKDRASCNLAPVANGAYPVVISVVPGGGGPPVSSINVVQYTGNGLSCMGPPLPDQSNSPVNWWFTYKIRQTDNYLYLDDTRDQLVRLDRLSDVNQAPYSALAATFDQYRDYFYMFFNDQIGSRDNAGKRCNMVNPTHGHGHLKGFLIFEQDPVTLLYSGIHVMHSNPVFPAISGGGYYNINQGIRWLGAADYNQHFFCYQWNGLEQPFNYLIHNDAVLIDHAYNIPNLLLWNQVMQNTYPFFYDYMTLWERLPARVPNGGAPAQCTQACFSAACLAAIAVNPNVQNICYWQSGAFNVGAMTANYFMKTTIDPDNAGFPAVAAIHPPALSRFIVVNDRRNTYDGIDIWTVIANTYQRMMFIEMFYAIGATQTKPNSAVINVGYLHFPPNLNVRVFDIPTGTWIYSHYEYTGKKNEHAKMGIPMYPVVGANALNANENMFCVGDSNRHNGQGARGGGALCFQSPLLSYQFNRMVRSYNSIEVGTLTVQKPAINSMYFYESIIQPLKIARGAWANDINFEIMDAMNGVVTSKNPKMFGVVTAATLPNAQDINPEFPSLRTSMANADSGTGAINLGNIGADPSISAYVSDDTFALEYIAVDVTIASICDFVVGMFPANPCNDQNARRTRMTEALPLPPPVVFPNAYNQAYLATMALRTFDVLAINDFLVIAYTQEMRGRLHMNPATLPPVQYIIEPALQVPSVEGRFTLRKLAPICEEELSYDVVLGFALQQSNYAPQAQLIYNIDNNLPNWANGVLYAIAKYIYNQIPPIATKDGSLNACVQQYFPAMNNIGTYTEAKPVDVKTPTQWQLFYRTAAATWDMMNPSIANGNGGRTNRLNNADIITWQQLLNKVITLRQADGVTSLEQLIISLNNPAFLTPTNKESLENNYLIEKPVVVVVKSLVHTLFKSANSLKHQSIPKFKLSASMAIEDQQQQLVNNSILLDEFYNGLTPLDIDSMYLESPIQQLLATTSKAFNNTQVTMLSNANLHSLALAMSKWTTITGVNQAIQVLLTNTLSETQSQPIEFISELNRDQVGGLIELCYQYIDVENSLIAICTPMSMVSMTFFIESAIVSEVTSQVQFGDFNAYFLPKPPNYNGSISSEYDGMAIATINSKICDIQMMSTSDFQAHNFDGLCTGIGPVVVNITNMAGPTESGSTSTINGFRFNSSIDIQIGNYPIVNPQYISSTQIVFNTPAGVGTNLDFYFLSSTTLFNLQRTKFYFSFDAPTVTGVSPSTLDSQGSTVLTLTGTNFGTDPYSAKVTVDESTPCYPILGITSTMLACFSPSGIGQDKTVQVEVGGQTSTFTLETIPQVSFDYEAPQLSDFIPPAGDPGDIIVIHGDGFGTMGDGNAPPMVFLGDELLQVVEYSNTYIKVLLDEGVGSNQSITIQAGDQTSPFYTEFGYLPPVISSVIQSNPLSTSGGSLQINGEGWGLSPTEIDYVYAGPNQLYYCSPFETFIECFVPPGIGAHLVINASVGGQAAIDQAPINYISYTPPSISSYKLVTVGGTNVIQISGTNFVPVGVNWTPDTSYISINYVDNSNVQCLGFINHTFAQCNVTNNIAWMVMSVGGQLSQEIYITPNQVNLQLFVFNDTSNNGLYTPGSENPISGVSINLTDSTGHVTTYTTDTTGYINIMINQNEYTIVVVGGLNQSMNFASINNIVVDLTQSKNISIPVGSTSIYGCIGTLTASKATMTVRWGTTQISNWGFCQPNNQTACQYMVISESFPLGCVPLFGLTEVNVRYSTTLTLYAYMDNNVTGQYTGIAPPQTDYNFMYTFYFNGRGWSMSNTPYPNGIYSAINVPPGDVTVTFWSQSASLIPIMNRATFNLPASKETTIHNVYYGFYNATSPYNGNLYPASTFSNQDYSNGAQMSLPLGKYDTSFLSTYNFVNSTRSYWASSAYYNVYLYSNSTYSVITGIPTNGGYNLVNNSDPAVGAQFEISSSTLFSFLNSTGPLSASGQNVTFPTPYVYEQPVYSIDVSGVIQVIPCITGSTQWTSCQFPANSAGIHTIYLTWRGQSLYQTYNVWYASS
ncbi:hypothetical protein SAMD00019534_027680 [Acytostelium subglobosum LB1]|uniref:hypothetical protein n=1 Tax=Acytostelium subglobosum LB1 TaxID=1410327 RepID=UPI000644F4B9|nr:hypothetical protein SAMD00019534_027680 [Acytostelium subglobosum LB1]GAM19593.1 hypothetical protein SAMD00019534_027680 [Acytostelium subglobosum LB1]|eukprot:XP_012756355.1 hypothetical protein SAMD00019534_027680 [Acytostelium subglobosum LB1]